MSALTPQKLMNSFVKFGSLLECPSDELMAAIQGAQHKNAWFTPEMVLKALAGLRAMLQVEDISQWFSSLVQTATPKKIGLVLAGNIPFVGLHDILCVIATGNIAMIKLSSSDDLLIPTLLSELVKADPEVSHQIEYTDRLANFDAVIATGSNNSSRYFDHYFGKFPHIIRKNRNSVAVLTGEETTEEIQLLGNDIFDYYGLGCRNVSKIFIPEGYDIKSFFEPLEIFQSVINHFKYNNNYDYNKSIYLVNSVTHFDNGFLLLKEDESLTSPLAVLFYETYTSLSDVQKSLVEKAGNIQCVVSASPAITDTIPFGKSQQPKLWDYADNINTVEFLMSLS